MAKCTGTVLPSTAAAASRTASPKVFSSHSCEKRFGTPTVSWPSHSVNFVCGRNQMSYRRASMRSMMAASRRCSKVDSIARRWRGEPDELGTASSPCTHANPAYEARDLRWCGEFVMGAYRSPASRLQGMDAPHQRRHVGSCNHISAGTQGCTSVAAESLSSHDKLTVALALVRTQP